MHLSYLEKVLKVSNHPPMEKLRVFRTPEERLEILVTWAKSGIPSDAYARSIGIKMGTLGTYKYQYVAGVLGNDPLVDAAIAKNKHKVKKDVEKA